jgi:hypothetical protein
VAWLSLSMVRWRRTHGPKLPRCPFRYNNDIAFHSAKICHGLEADRIYLATGVELYNTQQGRPFEHEVEAGLEPVR